MLPGPGRERQMGRLLLSIALAFVCFSWSSIAESPGGLVVPNRDQPASPTVSVKAEKGWEIMLGSPVTAAPQIVYGPAGEPLVLLALQEALEARRPADGVVAWRRERLSGSGLTSGPPISTSLGAALTWAGSTAEGARFLILSAADGRTLAEVPLPQPPSGPPAPVRIPGNRWVWFIPLTESGVAAISEGGTDVTRFSTPASVLSPLWDFNGRGAMVLATAERTVATVGLPPAVDAPRGWNPGTIARGGRGEFLVARDRSFGSWRCKAKASGPVRCHMKWEQRIGGQVTAPATVWKDRAIVPARDGHLYAFTLDHGHLLWRTLVGVRLSTALSPWKQFLAAVGEGTSQIFFFDRESGKVSGRIEGEPDEVFPAGAATAGDWLLVPFLPSPALVPGLRGYRLSVETKQPSLPAAPPAGPAAPPAEEKKKDQG